MGLKMTAIILAGALLIAILIIIILLQRTVE